jgi:CheY-like chemotaxis protein
MNRILLVDDSPHAQRMGERILSEEGYEVVAVSNADSALIRMEDVDPDVVLADVVMPGRGGYEICQYLKMSPRHRRVRVILTAGAQEPFDEARATLVEADGAIEEAVRGQRPCWRPSNRWRKRRARTVPSGSGRAVRRFGRGPRAKPPAAPFVAVVDSEQVRAAVTWRSTPPWKPWSTKSPPRARGAQRQQAPGATRTALGRARRRAHRRSSGDGAPRDFRCASAPAPSSA